MNPIFIIIIILISILIFILYFTKQDKIEGYNDQTGRYCHSCSDKTFNNCLNCFNCGWCVDNFGNGICMGGDHRGPYNYENCAKWFRGKPNKSCTNGRIAGCIGGTKCQKWIHGDPFYYMLQKKQQRKDSYCLL